MTKHWRDAMKERNQDWINSRDKSVLRTSVAGKGDRMRPVNKDKFNDNWDRIFGNKESKNED